MATAGYLLVLAAYLLKTCATAALINADTATMMALLSLVQAKGFQIGGSIEAASEFTGVYFVASTAGSGINKKCQWQNI